MASATISVNKDNKIKSDDITGKDIGFVESIPLSSGNNFNIHFSYKFITTSSRCIYYLYSQTEVLNDRSDVGGSVASMQLICYVRLSFCTMSMTYK